jgi:hypothetical protein
MAGFVVMRQSSAETLVTEEPYELIAHVRVCGGAGWVTTGSTRKPTNSVKPQPSQQFRAVGSTLPGKASVMQRTLAYFPSQ